MNSNPCLSCGKSANHLCGVCEKPLCKKCAEYSDVTEVMSLQAFCSCCYVSQVMPEIQIQRDFLKKAKHVIVVEKPSRRKLPLLKKSEKQLLVTGCKDREETYLKLALQAAKLGFNAIIRTNVESRKVRNFGYQKLEWSGSCYGAELDSIKYERQTE